MSDSEKKRKQIGRLADDTELHVIYADATPFGSVVSGRLGQTIRERCAPAMRYAHKHGMNATVAAGPRLLAQSLRGGLGELYRGGRQLRQDVLYPPQRRIRPLGVIVLREGQEIVNAPMPPVLISDLAKWVGEWSRRATAPREGPARHFFDQLVDAQAFTGPADRLTALPACDGRFIGHASVALGSDGPVVVDPFLMPRSPRYSPSYQPIVASQLGSPTAVCITHSHPDHFSLGSLLRFGADTPIIVPRVERESALSIDMATRLKELGFRDVSALGWNETLRIPGGRIVALPFYGEQPTTGERLHPEVRNEGNAYLVELGGRKFLLVADCGRDAGGDGVGLAEKMRQGVGQVTVLFGGYRSFPAYPIEYLFSSVAPYLLFVPQEGWGQRQRIMYDEDELVDLAESWRARYVVPYACGGAPWYGGVGPGLDEPLPELVAAAARSRAGPPETPHASSVGVEILRPGDGFRVGRTKLRVIRKAPHAWPVAEATSATR